MTELLTRIAPHQTDHLFILVGGNPLPCYIAGKLLVKPGGTIYLVYSTKTKDYANSLSVALDGSTLVPLGNTERNPDKIYEQVYRAAKDLQGKIGLHYTGGTKVMSVHSYRAILQKHPDAICSYLDPDRLELCFEQHGQAYGSPIKLNAAETNAAINLTLHQLWQLHNKKPLLKEHKPKIFSERTTPLLPGLAPLLAKHFSKVSISTDNREVWEGQAWIDSFKGEKRLEDHVPINMLPYQDIVNLLEEIKPAVTTIGELKSRLGSRANNYLGEGGDWLEDLVLQYLDELKDELALNNIVCSAATRKGNSECRGNCEREMELDVVAIRGYQLFIFSCYAGKNMDTCKAKLYEAAIRARQLGGSEARFALVCGHHDKAKIEDQMSGTTLERSFKVFDRYDLPDLKVKIRQWICEVDKETSQ